MAKRPNDLYSRLTKMIKAWEMLRPDKPFAGYTLAAFKAVVEPSISTRQEAIDAEALFRNAVARRKEADTATDRAMSRVVYAVLADHQEGEDGELYVGMGFMRRSERTKRQSLRRAYSAGMAAAATEEETTEEVTN